MVTETTFRSAFAGLYCKI